VVEYKIMNVWIRSMEIGATLCSKEVVAAVSSSLVPLALHLGSSVSCLGHRLRSPTRIQKHCLVVPHKGGKSYLHDKLQSQRSVLVVDVDEHIRLGCEAGKVLKMEKARIDSIEHDMEYVELANEVLAQIKVRLAHNKKLRVLFLTSSLAWANQFKKDAVYIASPDSEFWDDILKGEEDEGKRDVLRKARDIFIKSVPDARAISTYNSLKELERMVRARFGIVHTL